MVKCVIVYQYHDDNAILVARRR